jgi:CheY-like chemotaxis protein
VTTDGTRPAILVVEDNGALRRLIARVLSGSDFQVVEAATAQEGLTLFGAHAATIALVIVDMVMPGMSGLDLAAELERQRPGIRILYISGYGSSVAMESIRQRSPERVLLKPFDPADLVGRVRQLLGPAPDLAADSPRQATAPRLAWDRLIEASDALAPGAVEVIGYLDTSAGFAVAAAHSAALRAANLFYAFRAKNGGATRFGLFVAPDDVAQVRQLIQRIGLGADVIAQPV